jgi:hypothetical protein
MKKKPRILKIFKDKVISREFLIYLPIVLFQVSQETIVE